MSIDTSSEDFLLQIPPELRLIIYDCAADDHGPGMWPTCLMLGNIRLRTVDFNFIVHAEKKHAHLVGDIEDVLVQLGRCPNLEKLTFSVSLIKFAEQKRAAIKRILDPQRVERHKQQTR
ncbi:uncharacterized protein LTR77_000825 [Saxophila tyrrhenica]|uniref:F-box domain-containing protein n=1 Tax=Saxophila tyrrhenica TaxID=1690608 RepID=A0AAV9PPL8_9PEZI|nr:hypothetical protein LTR77_000825 [Saxophila tyrrhenica]